MNTLSVILVTHNSGNYLEPCLKKFGKNDFYNIIIIDNNSHDATRSLLKKFKNHVVLLNDSNTGYTHAVNQGIKKAQGEFILILNPDIEISEDTIHTLITELQKDSTIGIIAPKLLYSDGRLQYSCRRFPTFFTFLLRGLGCTEDRSWMPKLLHHHLMTEYDHSQPRNVDWVLGACMLVRRELFTTIGLLDEGYFLYYSDIEFCVRANNFNWKVRYEPRVSAIHHYGRTSARGGLSPAKRAHIKDALRFFWRRFTNAI